jgi:hypothetical protein
VTLPTRQIDAAIIGEPKYMTGKPCKHGHISPRWTMTGTCCQCTIELGTARRAAFKVARANRLATEDV